MKTEIVTIDSEYNGREYALEFTNIKIGDRDLGPDRILLKFDSFEYDEILGDLDALTFLNKIAAVIQTELWLLLLVWLS